MIVAHLLVLINSFIFSNNFSSVYCETPPNWPLNIEINTGTYENWSIELTIKNLWFATPSDANDVVTIANWAYVNGYNVRATGCMHNWSPLTITKTNNKLNVVLVDTKKHLNKIEVINSLDSTIEVVKVQTGVIMNDLTEFLEKNGLGLHGMPAVGDVTVGGVLVIGGHGTGIPPVGEETNPLLYATLSNLVITLTAVVWNEDSKSFTLKTFERSDGDINAFLVHLGRAFITEVTLMVIPNYNLRCQSFTHISVDELFASPASIKSKTRTFSSYLEKTRRVEVIVFPFMKNPWLKLWTVAEKKPPGSRRVYEPYNYPLTDNIGKKTSELYFELANGLSFLNPLLSGVQVLLVSVGDIITFSADIWGPSKNLLLYVQPSTLRETANGYAIITKRSNVQYVVSTFMAFVNKVLYSYAKRGQFPINGQIEFRATQLDERGPNGEEPPILSAAHPVYNHPEYDTVIWVDVLTSPDAKNAFEALSIIESFLFDTFHGQQAIVRIEWSKGWAYTNKSAFSNALVYGEYTPKSLSSVDYMEWNSAISILDKYDPHRVFTNAFVDKLLVKK